METPVKVELPNMVALRSRITKNYLFLTLKYSKGCSKCIHVGAHDYNVQTLVIKASNKEPLNSYSLVVNPDKKSAIFKQDEKGEFQIKITEEFSIESMENPGDLESYIESDFRRFYKGSWIKYKKYIPLTKNI